MIRTFKTCAALFVASSLIACTTLDPLVFESKRGYDELLDQVLTRAEAYGRYANEFSNSTLGYDIGIALLAAGSVAAAVFSHGAAKGNLLAGLGIGAGGASVIWAAYKPDEKRTAYRIAYVQAYCVYDTGLSLSDKVSSVQHAVIKKNVDDLNTAIDGIEKQISKLLPISTSAEWRGNVADAQLALPYAQGARDSGFRELQAYETRESTVRRTLATIDTTAEGTSRTVSITFSDARGTILSAAVPPAPAPASSTKAGPDVTTKSSTEAGRIASVTQDQFDKLIKDTNAMTALAKLVNNEKFYTPVIADIKSCADGSKAVK